MPVPQNYDVTELPTRRVPKNYDVRLTLLENGRCRSGRHTITSNNDVYISPKSGWNECRKCRSERGKYRPMIGPRMPPVGQLPLISRGVCRSGKHLISSEDHLDGNRCRSCRIIAQRRSNGTDVNLPILPRGRRSSWYKPPPETANYTPHEENKGLFSVTLHCTHPLLFKKGNLPKKGEELYCQRCQEWGEVL